MHRWRFWQKTEPDRTVSPAEPDRRRELRRAELRQRRRDALFDVEQAELALAPDNPWTERIDLLTETLATVEADLTALDALPPAPSFPLPPTPLADLRAEGDESIEVAFRIGEERFVFREEADWDQRGGPTVRGDLRRQEGDPTALVPAETPAERREALAQHLFDSLDVFATDLRDRALSGDRLPVNVTLADLAAPCPTCGGWRDWHGRCPECARRDLRRRALRAEAERLEAERAAEAEERHRLSERLPIARRRLAQVEAEIAALDG